MHFKIFITRVEFAMDGFEMWSFWSDAFPFRSDAKCGHFGAMRLMEHRMIAESYFALFSIVIRLNDPRFIHLEPESHWNNTHGSWLNIVNF